MHSKHCQTSTIEGFAKLAIWRTFLVQARKIQKVLIFFYISGNRTF